MCVATIVFYRHRLDHFFVCLAIVQIINAPSIQFAMQTNYSPLWNLSQIQRREKGDGTGKESNGNLLYPIKKTNI